MYQKIIILIFFCSFAVMADEDSEICLGVQRLEQNRLSFVYTKQDEVSKPYFYAKVTEEENKDVDVTFNAILGMPQHLFVVSTTDGIKQYQVPENMKKLYVVKSRNPLAGFDLSERIIPSKLSNETHILEIRKKRGAGNRLIELPKETEKAKKTRGIAGEDDEVKICEFEL